MSFRAVFGPTLRNGIEVIATKQDTEIDELVWSAGSSKRYNAFWVIPHLSSCPYSNPSRVLSRWISWIGSLRCSLKVKCRSRDWRVRKSECPCLQKLLHIPCQPVLAQRTLCLCLGGCYDVGNTHQLQYSRLHSSLCSLVTLTVRLENFSTSSAVPVSFASSCCSLASVLPRKSFGQLARLQLGWCAIKYVQVAWFLQRRRQKRHDMLANKATDRCRQCVEFDRTFPSGGR